MVGSRTPGIEMPRAAVFGVGYAIAAPLLYAAIGFLTGALGAALYNLSARWAGGIEVEVE